MDEKLPPSGLNLKKKKSNSVLTFQHLQTENTARGWHTQKGIKTLGRILSAFKKKTLKYSGPQLRVLYQPFSPLTARELAGPSVVPHQGLLRWGRPQIKEWLSWFRFQWLVQSIGKTRAWRGSTQENSSPDFSLRTLQCIIEEWKPKLHLRITFIESNLQVTTQTMTFHESQCTSLGHISSEWWNWVHSQTDKQINKLNKVTEHFFWSHTWQQNQNNLWIDNWKVKRGIKYLPGNAHHCNMIGWVGL